MDASAMTQFYLQSLFSGKYFSKIKTTHKTDMPSTSANQRMRLVFLLFFMLAKTIVYGLPCLCEMAHEYKKLRIE